MNRLEVRDRPAHDWYRFVLSFPPHLVRDYLRRFSVEPGQRVLDPFCGTGTTVVECKKRGFASVGVEANSLVHFASVTKVGWSVSGRELRECAPAVAEDVESTLNLQGIVDDPEP